MVVTIDLEQTGPTHAFAETLYQKCPTIRTPSVYPLRSGEIDQIDIWQKVLNPVFQFDHGSDLGLGHVRELVLRQETEDVPGYLRVNAGNLLGHSCHVIETQGRDKGCGHLDMDPGLF